MPLDTGLRPRRASDGSSQAEWFQQTLSSEAEGAESVFALSITALEEVKRGPLRALFSRSGSSPHTAEEEQVKGTRTWHPKIYHFGTLIILS